MKVRTNGAALRVLAIQTLASLVLANLSLTFAQEIPALSGWQIALPTPGTHRGCVDLKMPRSGKGCGKIVGTASEKGARGCFIQEFYRKTAVKPGRAYRYALSFRTAPRNGGAWRVADRLLHRRRETSHKTLVSQNLRAA